MVAQREIYWVSDGLTSLTSTDFLHLIRKPSAEIVCLHCCCHECWYGYTTRQDALKHVV